MVPERCCVRVAMLNADTSTPNVYGGLGTFGDILQRVLAAAAPQAQKGLSIRHSVYNVVDGQYPESLDDVDAIVITASAASSYDDQYWIKALERYVVMLFRQHRRIKMFGSCFGHHLICQALLRDCGLRVEKHPDGWEIGISEVLFTEDFRQAFDRCESMGDSSEQHCNRSFGRLPSPAEDDESEDDNLTCHQPMAISTPAKARLQFVHADQVSCHSPLPKPWKLVGSTEHCAIQGVYLPGRVLTLQGHFEFDKFDNRDTMKIFGASSGAEPGSSAKKEAADGEDDGEVVAEMVVRFLSQGHTRHDDEHEAGKWPTRLPTPRTSTERF